MPYTALQQSIDATAPRGQQYYLKAQFLMDLDDATIEAAIEHHSRITSPLSGIGFTLTGGAIKRVDPRSSAFSHRHSRWMCDILAAWPVPEPDPTVHVKWARSLWRAVTPASTGSYVNHLDADEHTDTGGYDPGTHAKLVRIKTVHDPDNVFRLNPNIRPEPGPGGSRRAGMIPSADAPRNPTTKPLMSR